jgi:hypothetical protein
LYFKNNPAGNLFGIILKNRALKSGDGKKEHKADKGNNDDELNKGEAAVSSKDEHKGHGYLKISGF